MIPSVCPNCKEGHKIDTKDQKTLVAENSLCYTRVRSFIKVYFSPSKELIHIKGITSRIRRNDLDDINKYIVKAYLAEVQDILDHPFFHKLENYSQHGSISRRQHCINVSYYSYRLCRFFNLDARAAARGGLLHDLFFYQWQDKKAEDSNFHHVYDHPFDALENARSICEISKREADIITKHMFPFCYGMPRYKETIIISLVDKVSATFEGFASVFSRVKHGAKRGVKAMARYF